MSTCSSPGPSSVIPSPDELARHAARLKALAHPVRLHMLALIAAGDGDTCICRIQDQFELSQPTLSHHASVLRQAGLITSRQDGVWVHHSAVPSALESLVDLLSTLVPPTAQTVAR